MAEGAISVKLRPFSLTMHFQHRAQMELEEVIKVLHRTTTAPHNHCPPPLPSLPLSHPPLPGSPFQQELMRLVVADGDADRDAFSFQAVLDAAAEEDAENLAYFEDVEEEKEEEVGGEGSGDGPDGAANGAGGTEELDGERVGGSGEEEGAGAGGGEKVAATRGAVGRGSIEVQLATVMKDNVLLPALRAVRDEESGTMWLLMKPQ
jgi:hypothetical protein